MKVLVTGATGYIGGRLVPRLLRRGCSVRVLVRDPGRIEGRWWADQVEVQPGDLLESETLHGSLDGVDAAYYLVHSMYGGAGFAARDRLAAENFCRIAASLPHVIYLGGLQPQEPRSREHAASRHLGSRAEIGRILSTHLPTTELRAGPIIGSGSASFEMIRYLTERMPLILAPSWVRNEVAPIAVRDVQAYLMSALESGPSRIVEIGSERLTYEQMLQGYARVRGLKRRVVSVPPFLPAWMGAGLISLLTPIPRTLAGPLVVGMAQPLIAQDCRARTLFPQIEPISYEQAVRLALRRVQDQAVETRWTGVPASSAPAYEHRDSEGMIRDVRTLHVDAAPDDVFRVFTGLGGDRGWLVWSAAWWARGLLDRLVGGPGLRRGRRHPQELLKGEVVDCWRVEAISPDRLLRLRAETRLPGRAWLQWEATPEHDGTCLVQTAAFAPHGLAGTLYWYALYSIHRRIFTDLIRAIGRTAASLRGAPGQT